MKNFITILAVLIALSSCSDSTKQTADENGSATTTGSTTSEQNVNDSTLVIGQLNDGNPSFVADSSILKSDWQHYLNSSLEGSDCHLNHIFFLSNDGKYYLAVAGSQGDLPIRSTLPLTQSPAGCMYVTGLTITCTTNDCASESFGCIPNLTSCTPCSNNGKCTKSISNTPLKIFSSFTATVCPE